MTVHVDSLGEAGLVARLARKLLEHLRALTRDIDEVTAEFTTRITVLAPALLTIVGAGR